MQAIVLLGDLESELEEGLWLEEAVERACHAASIAVTRSGAQTGMPFRHGVVAGR